MENAEILLYIALILTFLLHLSGISPCFNMWKTRSTSNVPFYVFILSAMNCSGMMYYSLLIKQESILYLNIAGFLLYVFYIGSYLLCAEEKLPSFVILSSIVAGQLGHFYWVHYILEDDFKADSIGKLVLTVNLLIIMTVAWEVIMNLVYKDAKGMPVIMIFANLLCMTSWLLYGLYLNNFFIYFPNIPGVLVMITKLLLSFIFCRKSESQVLS